jgi:hypothetical protein
MDEYMPLSTALFVSVDVPDNFVYIMSRELWRTLTVRSLLNLCTAVKQRPGAVMLALALQNSIPSLVADGQPRPRVLPHHGA